MDTKPKTGQFVLIGQNRWGSGNTLKDAKARFQREGGRLSFGYVLLEFDSVTEFHGVDPMGRYHYKTLNVTNFEDHHAPVITEVGPKRKRTTSK